MFHFSVKKLYKHSFNKSCLFFASYDLYYKASNFSMPLWIVIFLSKFDYLLILYGTLHFQCYETSLRVLLIWIFSWHHFLWDIFILFVIIISLIYVVCFTKLLCAAKVSWTEATSTFPQSDISSTTPLILDSYFQCYQFPLPHIHLCWPISSFDYAFL